jgi:hypothetical protein
MDYGDPNFYALPLHKRLENRPVGPQVKNALYILKGWRKKRTGEEYATQTICGPQSIKR